MASLFDNRYQYDYIYPRGRSGETLRAVDTTQQNRPVVIKRPAPQDAPPLRAAQEVSILTEKKALERLSGHPSLAGLHASGVFRAGGQGYTYIVMERAEGIIIESMILELAQRQEAFAELEILVILDQLLDLLAAAHQQHVVYNDVDAKHLFWNRDHYRLKVIDWGNAILTDEARYDGKVTTAADIYQVGELLYFIYHGGARLASETTPDGEYQVSFGAHVAAAMQDIIRQATHPNIKAHRYSNIGQLRTALAKYRQPLEAQRDALLLEVNSAYTTNANKQSLQAWDATLEKATQLDPAYPPLRKLRQNIQLQLQYIAVQADFDAARIYVEQGNWERAIGLIEALIPNADAYTAKALRFLVMAAEQLRRGGHNQPPDDFDQVIDLILSEKVGQATRLLFAIAAHDSDYHTDVMLMIERLANIMPDVVVLRPHLVRLQQDNNFHGDVDALLAQLDAPIEAGISPLMERYGKLAIQLTDWDSERFPALTYAEAASREVVNQLKYLQEIAYSTPDAAHQTLDIARRIDPMNPHFDAIDAYLEKLHDEIELLGNFRPDASGASILEWVEIHHARLEPLNQDLRDERFRAASGALINTGERWQQAMDMILLGRKKQTVRLYEKTAKLIQPYNQHVAQWFQKSAKLIADAKEVERFASNQALVEYLLDGYRAWDEGKIGKAADFARRALPLAQSYGETLAVQRLHTLAQLTADWLNQGNVRDPELTAKSEQIAFGMLLPDERQEYDQFAEQMPTDALYLKAMKRGIVDVMANSSSASLRALFVHYALRGVMDIQDGELQAAEFWYKAALTTQSQWKTHPVLTAFDGELTRRQLIIAAEEALQNVQSITDLKATKDVLNAPLADDALKETQHAIQRFEDSLGAWEDGEYRAARNHIKDALTTLEQVEASGTLQVTDFGAWMQPYFDRVTELMERRQIVEQAAMAGSTKADPAVLRALEQMVEISQQTLGSDYARQPKIWRDLYRQMLQTHTNSRLTKRQKLDEFATNFAALFIDKHPAYRLFQRWEDAARQLPDDIAEDYQIEVDTTTEAPIFADDSAEIDTYRDARPLATDEPPTTFDDSEPIVARRPSEAETGTRRRLPWFWLLSALLIVVAIGGGIGLQVLNSGSSAAPTATPTRNSTLSAQAATGTATALGIIPPTIPPTRTPTDRPTRTPIPSETSTPQDTNTPTPTEEIPTIAPTLTATQAVTIVTNTPPARPTSTIILPTDTPLPIAPDADTVVNALDVLTLIQPDDYVWDDTFFSEGAGGVWQLGATVEEVGSAPIAITLDPDFLDAFASDTATRLRRVEVEMELALYDESLVGSGQVFFGVALENQRRQRYGTQVLVRGANVVSLGINQNASFQAVSQLPVSPIRATLAIERNPDNSLSFFVNGQQLGDSPTIFPIDEPVYLVLYNAGGGMFVSVPSIRLELAPTQP